MATEKSSVFRGFKKIMTITVIVAVLVLAAAVILILQQQSKKPGSQNQPQAPATSGNNGPTGAGSSSPTPVAVKQTLSYVGKVQSLTNNGFVLLVSSTKNQLPQDKIAQVRVSNLTRYTQVGGEVGLVKIAFKDLKMGDLVIVFSNSDIAGQSSFEAATVQKIK